MKLPRRQGPCLRGRPVVSILTMSIRGAPGLRFFHPRIVDSVARLVRYVSIVVIHGPLASDENAIRDSDSLEIP